MFALGRKFASHVIPGIIRPLRVLWNEIIGFIFIALAVIAAPRAFKSWQEFNGEADQFFRLSLTVLFLVTMLAFGVSSFRRARKINRS